MTFVFVVFFIIIFKAKFGRSEVVSSSSLLDQEEC